MAKGEYYTVRRVKTTFRVFKCDSDFSPTGHYDVRHNGRSLICDCFAATRDTCRHREMIGIFQAAGRLDTGGLYDYDNRKWVTTRRSK